MKMMFKIGVILKKNELDGSEDIIFRANKMNMNDSFYHSVRQVVRYFSNYDVGSVHLLESDSDIYYLYNKKNDKEIIKKEVEKIASGDTKDVINRYEVFIRESVLNKVSDNYKGQIFWDVCNDMIITVDKSSLLSIINWVGKHSDQKIDDVSFKILSKIKKSA